MTIPEIEALSFTELKDQRDTVTESLKDEAAPVLAARYVKASMDAKRRDELLGEQGRTITALRDGLTASKGQAATAAKAVEEQVRRADALAADLETVRASARQVVQDNQATLIVLQESLDGETARANRLKAEATRNHAALSQAAKLLNDALAAQAVDKADSGE